MPDSLVTQGWSEDDDKYFVEDRNKDGSGHEFRDPQDPSDSQNSSKPKESMDAINKEELESEIKAIVKSFLKAELLVMNDAINVVVERKLKPREIIKKAKENEIYFVTREFIEGYFPEQQNEQEFSFIVHRGSPPLASRVDSRLEIQKDKDVTGRSASEGTIENFVELFKDRYKKLRSIIMGRVNYKNITDIENLKRYDNNEVRVIGMLNAIRTSKKGNLILEIEDLTGTALVVCVGSTGSKINFVEDGVIGVYGKVKNGMILAKEIVEPEIPMSKPLKRSDEPVSVAFLSDIHVGSLLFMEREFNRFLDWLNLKNNGSQREIAESIKYISIAGDLVDGIGIYPNQEKELSIPDIYKQYDFLAKLIEQIPSYIEVIVSVGNHDAVRRSEPQPSLSAVVDSLTDLPNVHLVGSPAWVGMHGVDTLIYHGTSMDSLVSSSSNLSYNAPEIVQMEYLKKRHLNPTYGKKGQTAPEMKDFMVIDEVPDILHCGHVHKNGYSVYRNVRIINSGTWQAQTDYQVQQGHIPTPCKVPIMNLRSMDLKVVNFSA